MKINRDGITRVVLLTKRYAIKFPRFNKGWVCFVQGLYSNLSEHSCWKVMKRVDDVPMLCPVLFCFAGFFNVMPRIEICTTEQQIACYPMEERDDHKPDNYGIYNGRVVCVDYPYYKIKPYKR